MMPIADLIALPYITRETYCHCIAHKTFHCSSGVPWSPTNYKCIIPRCKTGLQGITQINCKIPKTMSL